MDLLCVYYKNRVNNLHHLTALPTDHNSISLLLNPHVFKTGIPIGLSDGRHLGSFWSETANPQWLLTLPCAGAEPGQVLWGQGADFGVKSLRVWAQLCQNWFLILLDGLKRSSCSDPMKELWTPKYKLSSGQRNSSNWCIYFPFSWFGIAVPRWDGRPWPLLLSWMAQVSLQQVPELSPAQWWIHPQPHKSHGCSPSPGMDGSVVQETKGCVGYIDFGLFIPPPSLGQDCWRFIFSALSSLMANCSKSGASPTSFGRIFHSLMRFQHLEVYPA